MDPRLDGGRGSSRGQPRTRKALDVAQSALVTAFRLLALLVAAIGLHSLLSFDVA